MCLFEVDQASDQVDMNLVEYSKQERDCDTGADAVDSSPSLLSRTTRVSERAMFK